MVVDLLYIARYSTDLIRILIGLFHRPYETYRTLSQRQDLRFVPFVFVFILVYLLLAGVAKGGLRIHPLFLTASFFKIVSGIAALYIGVIFFFIFCGRVLQAEVNIKRLINLWTFTLIPTALWFIMTPLFFIVLPPPRGFGFAGQLASSVFIALSISLLFWKIILYYLTLRFGLKISMGKILVITTFFLPLASLMSIILNRMGVFRVPFL